MSALDSNGRLLVAAVLAFVLLHGTVCAKSPETGSAQLPTGSRISFQNDVVPVLIKSGCNLGACHGAMTGKGDLALSLRGEDPAKDFEVLVNSFLNKENPEQSQLLRKPALDGVEHQGGKRFGKDSEAYRILRKWVAQGAPRKLPNEPKLVKLQVTPEEKIVFEPEKSVQIEVVAQFSDGTTREVRQWAVYESSSLIVEPGDQGLIESLRPGETTVTVRYLGRHRPVRLAFVPERPDFSWSNPPAFNYIDKHLMAKWKAHRLNPSELCDDATFVRRVYLDLVGVIPSAEEARKFVADKSTDKRNRLVDALLETGEFADFQALRWADLLRVEEKLLDRKGVAAFHSWIRESILRNKPLDQFAREILTATGSTYDHAPSNYYRALRTPDSRAEAVAQVFLGTRLGCAKCHNHPFEKWTMDDYYEFAAIFDGVGYDIKENKKKDKNDKNMFIGEQVVKLVNGRSLKHPSTEKPPAPRLLGEGEALEFNNDRFDRLADWITAQDNPLFARVQANRIWYHLMGNGLVNPVDDFRATNPPVNPDLLDALAEDFVESGYDLRHMIRTICASRAYQLSSVPNQVNEDDTINFTHPVPARLYAEQILDSVHRAMGLPARFNEYPAEVTRASQVQGVQAAYRGSGDTHVDQFLKLFGKPPRLTNSDTERANDSSLAQVFELTSGPTVNGLLSSRDGTLSKLLSSEMTEPQRIEKLYWAVLTRAPNEEEAAAMADYVADAEDRRRAYEDIAWSLLNAKEFILRR